MDSLGNISLLEKPKHDFLCSRCTCSSAILPCLDWAVSFNQGDIPIMSTFHSEMEAAVLDILIGGKCPIILILGRRHYKAVPEKFKPLLDTNRLLILSLFEQSRITRNSAYECNKYICEQSSDVTFGYLSHNSSLQSLYETAINANKMVTVITKS